MTIALERKNTWILVTVAGCAAFTVVRFRTMLPPPHYGAIGVALTVGLAVVQEAVFRRFLYAQLERFGAAVALLATAALVARIHGPRDGWGVQPIDLAAGLIFGWQRYATGTWTSSAATHVLANLVSLW